VTEIAVIGAPTSLGAFAPGQERAPQALRDAGLVEMLGPDVADLGDLPVRRWRPDREQRHAQNAGGVAEVAGEVADRVEAALRERRTALVLGGDCTVEVGVVAGARRAGLERVGLLYFDMHPDLNTPETVVTGTLDWMGPGHMLALPGTVDAVARIGPRVPLLAPADLVLFAYAPDQTRPGEQRAIEEHGLEAIPLPDVAADPRGAAERALSLVRDRFDRYLLHFDVDVVDFVDLPLSENTGHNIGLPFAAAAAALETLTADPRLAALTVTEHNPAHGAEDGSTTAALAGALAAAVRSYRAAA
jgi:arginase